MPYIYSDETTFELEKSNSNKIIGVGVLLTMEPIPKNVITEALNNLANDDDKDKYDIKTLKRGYFHASEDSKNAHSHLCSSINKSINGYFYYSYSNENSESFRRKSITLEKKYQSLLALSSTDIFCHNDEVRFLLEERQSFGHIQARRVIDNLVNQLLLSTYNQPSFITYYPNQDVKMGTKNDPGLQVLDFLLWSVNRTYRRQKDTTWYDRIKKKSSSSHTIKDSDLQGGDFILNDNPLFYKSLNYPYHVKDPEGNDLYYCFELIETLLRQVTKLELPDSVVHYRKELNDLSYAVFQRNRSVTGEIIEKMCKLFLKLFDTLPLYADLDDDDEDAWKILLTSKKMAGLIIRTELIHSQRTKAAYLHWRNSDIVKSHMFSLG